MRSIYVIGGAGAGKSTFTSRLIDGLGVEYGPLEDLLALPNKKNIVTLRGHRLGEDGLYLGVKRDSFPGTDGLDRASSPVGEAWLTVGAWHPRYLIAEGATLATTRFLGALQRETDLLLVHLTVAPEIAALRFEERGSQQNAAFVAATRTRSLNRAVEIERDGGRVLSVDTADPNAVADALLECLDHVS